MSNARIIKEAFKDLLRDYQPHTRGELFEYARKQNSGHVFSDGMLTGALKTLTETGGEYKCISRATYQRIGQHTASENYMEDVLSQYAVLLKNSITMIENNVKIDPFKLMEINESDRQMMYEIRQCLDNMKKTLDMISR